MEEKKSALIRDEMSENIIETVEAMVMESGAHDITVRKVLKALNISNRVFYNRFCNIEEVLEAVYRNTAKKIRESTISVIDDSRDFFEQVMDLVVKSLILSYETKMRFNQYVFENDSLNENNYELWMGEITKLIEYAKARGYIEDVDAETLSYSIWCFCRGFNADAVARNLPREEAERRFRYSFSYLLKGLKK